MGGVRAVCDKGCSKSCGTAGHQTLSAARQSLADQADSRTVTAALAASQKRVDSLEIGRGFNRIPTCDRQTNRRTDNLQQHSWRYA